MDWLTLLIICVIVYAFFNERNRRQTIAKYDEMDLAGFRITLSPEHLRQPETENKQPGKWVQPDETVKIDKFEIKGGFIYIGGQLKSLDNCDTESSLIDPTLKINARSPGYRSNYMDYWPAYNRISPEMRAAYIKWLAGDRCDPEADIGHVFLYFYGIERRLLIDDRNGLVSDDEHAALIQELKRLKNVYGDSASFNSRVTDLLSYVWIINHKDGNELPDHDLLVANGYFTSVFKFLLANAAKNGEPVNEELALAWVKSHPELSLRTPARRCENEFDAIFKIRFKQRFDNGLKITINRTKLQFDYHPASASLNGYQSVNLYLPDVSRLKAPFKKLVTLAESCTDELEPFSRFVSKRENSHHSLAAFALLPGDLATSIAHSKFDGLKTWINTQVSESSSLVSTESMLQHFGEDAPLKIHKKEAEILSNIVEKAGFGIAPDIRFHHAKPDINGKVVLFAGGHGDNFSPSHAFRQMTTILRMGAMVAGIDSHIDDSEVSVLKNLITQNNQLTETDMRSLYAYMHWRLNTPANMLGLKACVQNINKHEKTMISHILISVALADGKINPAEIKQLEKLYVLLGLDKSMVSSDIHNLSLNKSLRPAQGEKTAIENLAGTQPVTACSFSLDRDLLKAHEEETRDVQVVLESIFADESVLDEPAQAPTGSTPAGLDSKHQHLYEKLITREEWSADDVKNLCKNMELMVDGAIEVINDWAFDNVDAPLIDDGSTVLIDLALAEELATLQIQD